MSGPRKRPDIAGRIAGELDDDLVAGHAVREVAGGDRQLVAAKRGRQPPAHEAVGTIGADDVRGPMARAAVDTQRHPTLVYRNICDPRLDERRTGALRRG